MLEVYKKYGMVLLILVLAWSCVPNKNLVYLQDEYYGEKEVPIDSVIKSYQLEAFEYRLQAGDIISIKITSLTALELNIFRESETLTESDDPRLSGFILDKEGYVELPDGMKIHLKDLTIPEAENKIQEHVAKSLSSPTVVIKHLNFQYTLLGEVNSPGRYTSYNNHLNMLEAIGMAGDMTDFADRAKVKIVRYEEGYANISYVNLLREEFLTSPYFYVMPNDVIYVSAVKAKNIRQYQLTNVTLLLSIVSALGLILTRF